MLAVNMPVLQLSEHWIAVISEQRGTTFFFFFFFKRNTIQFSNVRASCVRSKVDEDVNCRYLSIQSSYAIVRRILHKVLL